MDEIKENRLFLNFERCIKALNIAIEFLQDYLSERTSSDPSNYYEAQKFLEESKPLYKEAKKEIGALIGSLPADASPGFKKWKESFLKGTGIISESKEFEALRSELHHDRLLRRILNPEEIDNLLMKHYESQQTGKRILSNIKARLILDKIINLLDEAEILDKKAKEKLYQQK